MIEFLLDTSVAIGLGVFVLITISFSLIIYLFSSHLLKDHINKKHEKMGRLLFRVAASLLAFILSISFANQRVYYSKLQNAIEAEASAIVDLKIDLDFYQTAEANEVQDKIIDYVMQVSGDGWQSLQLNPLHSESIILFLEIYSDIQQLEPQTALQERLKGNMLSDIDKISDYLELRLYSSKHEFSPLIYISIFGLAAIMILFTVYPPDRITLLFLSIYVAFIGIVLYFILMMSNPLRGPLQIEPGPFLLLKETIEAHR